MFEVGLFEIAAGLTLAAILLGGLIAFIPHKPNR